MSIFSVMQCCQPYRNFGRSTDFICYIPIYRIAFAICVFPIFFLNSYGIILVQRYILCTKNLEPKRNEAAVRRDSATPLRRWFYQEHRRWFQRDAASPVFLFWVLASGDRDSSKNYVTYFPEDSLTGVGNTAVMTYERFGGITLIFACSKVLLFPCFKLVLFKMLFKGVVTEVDEFWLTFKMHTENIFHVGLYMAYLDDCCFPQITDNAEVVSHHFYQYFEENGKRIIVCPKGRITIDIRWEWPKIESEPSPFLDFIRKHSLGRVDLSKIDGMLSYVKDKLGDLFFEGEINKFLFQLLSCAAEDFEGQQKKNCDNEILENVWFRSVGDCSSVPMLTDDVITGKNLFCSPGYLDYNNVMGYLYITSSHSLVALKDTRNSIICIISCGEDELLGPLINKFVLIKKCTIFTEKYHAKLANQINTQVLYCDFKDVIVLNCRPKKRPPQQVFFWDEPPFYCQSMKWIEFILLNKSSVFLNRHTFKLCCYLEIKMGDKIEYLQLNAAGTYLYPLLVISKKYTLYFTKPIEKKKFNDIWKYTRTYLMVLPEQKVVIKQHCGIFPNLNKPLSIEEAFDVVKSGDRKPITVEAPITGKRFAEFQDYSRTKRAKIEFGFGTIGSKTPILEFIGDVDQDKRLTEYVNNFESMVTPYGLMPFVKIRMFCVQPQSKSYLKCTEMTSFEILKFEPPFTFNTVNLCTIDTNWGRSALLSDGLLLPKQVLCWCPVRSVRIRSFKISYNCEECNAIRKQSMLCRHCRQPSERVLQHCMTIATIDERGWARVIIKDVKMIMSLLEFTENEWNFFLSALSVIGQYQYQKFYKETEEEVFHLLDLHIASLNANGITNVDIMCRNFGRENEYDVTPVWYGLALRMEKLKKIVRYRARK